jgi:hypothetical protein
MVNCIINYVETTIIATKKGLNILKMSRKVLKNWGHPLLHIFQFEAARQK